MRERISDRHRRSLEEKVWGLWDSHFRTAFQGEEGKQRINGHKEPNLDILQMETCQTAEGMDSCCYPAFWRSGFLCFVHGGMGWQYGSE